MARTSIGLDIGTRSVRLAEVQMSSGKPGVTRFGRALLPVGSVERGEIHDPAAVATAITSLWKRLGLTGKAVHVGMASRRVVVRVIEVPAMSPEDLSSAIRFQAQEHIPIPLAEAVMDYEVLEEVDGKEGERLQRVLVVAAERSSIDPILFALKSANLEPWSLELNAYPLVRCFREGAAGAEAIVDMGAGVTTVVVHSEGKIRFTRILPTFGGDEFTTAIADRLGVSRDEAERLKRDAADLLRSEDRPRVTLGAAVGPQSVSSRVVTRPVAPRRSDEQPTPDEGVTTPEPIAEQPTSPVEAAASIIAPLLDRFITEVRGSLDFYSRQPGAAAVERVILTGGGALIGGLAEHLQTSLGTEVVQGHPFDHVPIAGVNVTRQERTVAEPFIGVAVGLALAGMEA